MTHLRVCVKSLASGCLVSDRNWDSNSDSNPALSITPSFLPSPCLSRPSQFSAHWLVANSGFSFFQTLFRLFLLGSDIFVLQFLVFLPFLPVACTGAQGAGELFHTTNPGWFTKGTWGFLIPSGCAGADPMRGYLRGEMDRGVKWGLCQKCLHIPSRKGKSSHFISRPAAVWRAHDSCSYVHICKTALWAESW